MHPRNQAGWLRPLTLSHAIRLTLHRQALTAASKVRPAVNQYHMSINGSSYCFPKAGVCLHGPGYDTATLAYSLAHNITYEGERFRRGQVTCRPWRPPHVSPAAPSSRGAGCSHFVTHLIIAHRALGALRSARRRLHDSHGQTPIDHPRTPIDHP